MIYVKSNFSIVFLFAKDVIIKSSAKLGSGSLKLNGCVERVSLKMSILNMISVQFVNITATTTSSVIFVKQECVLDAGEQYGLVPNVKRQFYARLVPLKKNNVENVRPVLLPLLFSTIIKTATSFFLHITVFNSTTLFTILLYVCFEHEWITEACNERLLIFRPS